MSLPSVDPDADRPTPIVMTNDWPIGVFTSIDEGLGVHWDVLRELNVPTIHLHAPGIARRTSDFAKELRRKLLDLQVEVSAVFGGFAGESYADIETTRQTVGLVPVATRQQRLGEMKQIAEFAAGLDCRVAALHLGFIPSQEDGSSDYGEIVRLTRELCDDCRQRRQSLHLETGQETAEDLVRFMDDVAADNLYVNFDPANMILYGTGDPIPAVRMLGNRIRSVHCKDARWSASPGTTWGQEVPVGDGEVNFPKFLRTLRDVGYRGPLTIEREIPHLPDQQRLEIGRAVQRLTQWRAELMS